MVQKYKSSLPRISACSGLLRKKLARDLVNFGSKGQLKQAQHNT